MKDNPEGRIDTLMVVDDNPVDQILYKRIIKRSGVVQNVIDFSLAEDALTYLQNNRDAMPDVILLDINMPRMDGFEFLEAAQEIFGAEFSVVVVMLTTSLDPRDQERAKTYDVVKDYMDKPLTVERVQQLTALV